MKNYANAYFGSACGTQDPKEEKPVSACGTACGSKDPE